MNIHHIKLFFELLKENKYNISYSQCGEDIIIDFIFNSMGIKKISYLDIGANDPVYYNNTYYFYKKGCRGVCIEPDKYYFPKYDRTRNKDNCLNIGISDDHTTKTSILYIMSTRTMNTFSKSEADLLVKENNFRIVSEVKVKLVPIDQIFNKYFKNCIPNLLSLDTEGYDLKILNTINFEKHRPQVVCVETLSFAKKNCGKKEHETISYLEKQNYFVYADTYINSILVDKSVWNK